VINEKLSGQKKKDRIKDLLLTPTNEMILNAIDTAEYSTFQNRNALSDAFTSFKETLKQPYPSGKVAPGRQVASFITEGISPFVRTITNVGLRILDFSPAGFIRATLNQIDPETRGQRALVRDVSRSLTGSTVIATGAYLAANGLMNGAAPDNEKEKEQFYSEGRQPYSIYLNGYWMQLNRISPIGNLLAIGAELYKQSEDKEGFDLAVAGLFSAAKNVKEQSMLIGISQFTKAIDYPTSAEKFINRSVASGIPAIVGRLARTVDPTLRKPEGLTQSIAVRLPFLSQIVPPKRNVFGEPVDVPGGSLSLFDPFSSTKPNQDPILLEASKAEVPLDIPNDKISGVKLNNREFDVYHKFYGKLLKQTLASLIQNPLYKDAPALDKKKNFEGIIKEVKEATDETVLPAILIRKFGLPVDSNPGEVIAIVSELNRKDKEFKRMNEKKQAELVKEFLNAPR
jgi:hypothetical protein